MVGQACLVFQDVFGTRPRLISLEEQKRRVNEYHVYLLRNNIVIIEFRDTLPSSELEADSSLDTIEVRGKILRVRLAQNQRSGNANTLSAHESFHL